MTDERPVQIRIDCVISDWLQDWVDASPAGDDSRIVFLGQCVENVLRGEFGIVPPSIHAHNLMTVLKGTIGQAEDTDTLWGTFTVEGEASRAGKPLGAIVIIYPKQKRAEIVTTDDPKDAIATKRQRRRMSAAAALDKRMEN